MKRILTFSILAVSLGVGLVTTSLLLSSSDRPAEKDTSILSLRTILSDPDRYSGKTITMDAHYFEAHEKTVLAVDVVVDKNGWARTIDGRVWAHWGMEPPRDVLAGMAKSKGVADDTLHAPVRVRGVFRKSRGSGHLGDYEYTFEILSIQLRQP